MRRGGSRRRLGDQPAALTRLLGGGDHYGNLLTAQEVVAHAHRLEVVVVRGIVEVGVEGLVVVEERGGAAAAEVVWGGGTRRWGRFVPVAVVSLALFF